MKLPIYLALGSNMAGAWGPPADALARALTELGVVGLKITAISRRYGTAAIGPRGQPDYHNLVVAVRTALEPRALLRHMKIIERRAGRTRFAARWTARPLDIDIIDYAGRVSRPGRRQAIGSLILPHPQMHRRPFVVIPLAEIVPRWRHPRIRQSIAAMRWRLARQSAGRITSMPVDSDIGRSTALACRQRA